MVGIKAPEIRGIYSLVSSTAHRSAPEHPLRADHHHYRHHPRHHRSWLVWAMVQMGEFTWDL